MCIFCVKMSSKKKVIDSKKPMPALKKLREEVGLTQAEFAKQIPDKTGAKTLTQATVSRWENGEVQPELTIPQIKALCRALGKSVEELPDDFGLPNSQD